MGRFGVHFTAPANERCGDGALPFRPLQGREALLYAAARERLFRLFLGSSAVEHSTVNRMVAGSNPARGAKRTFSFVLFRSQPSANTPPTLPHVGFRNGPHPFAAIGSAEGARGSWPRRTPCRSIQRPHGYMMSL